MQGKSPQTYGEVSTRTSIIAMMVTVFSLFMALVSSCTNQEEQFAVIEGEKVLVDVIQDVEKEEGDAAK